MHLALGFLTVHEVEGGDLAVVEADEENGEDAFEGGGASGEVEGDPATVDELADGLRVFEVRRDVFEDGHLGLEGPFFW